MKLITSFTQVTSLLFNRYLQATLLIIGLLLINFGFLVLFNAGVFLITIGISVIGLAFLLNYERSDRD
jgi:predicted membrane protein